MTQDPRKLAMRFPCKGICTVRSEFDPWQLAASGGSLQSNLSGDELPRVKSVVRRFAAPIRVELQGMTDASGRASLEGLLETVVELICQRCLKPMELEIRAKVKLALLQSEGQIARYESEFDPLVIPEGDLTSLPDLVTDELLLALPLAPCHDQGGVDADRCLGSADRDAYFGGHTQVQKPFAELAKLLSSKDTQAKE